MSLSVRFSMVIVMSRYLYVILMNLYRAPYMIPLMWYLRAHPEKYSEKQRYALAKHAIDIVNHPPLKSVCGRTLKWGLEWETFQAVD